VEPAALTPFLQSLQGPVANDNLPISVEEVGENWLAACRRRGLERASLLQYEQHLKYHINPLIGPLYLLDLTTPIVQKFADKLVQSRGPAMAKKALASLKSLLTEAQRLGYVRDNVATPVSVHRSNRLTKRIQIPTAEEVRATISAAEKAWRPLLATAALSGLRASELRGLGWSHVDFAQKIIRVRRRADRWNKIGPPKSKSGLRDIPFGGNISLILQRHAETCPRGDLDLVFPNGRGRVQPLSNIWRRGLAPAQKVAGIVDDQGQAKFSLHAFRHFAASLFIASRKFSPKEIQVVIGHASIVETFDVYGHLFAKRDDISEVMGDIESMVFEA
jgi:integrase